jgi:arginyl-tRNA synthetase
LRFGFVYHPREMSYDPLQLLSERFTAAIRAAFPELPAEAADPMIAPGRNPKFGDFQSNAAMNLAKVVGKPPREVAQRIVEHLDVAGVAEPLTPASIAGPGFINITLRADSLGEFVAQLDTPQLGIAPPTSPQTVVVDLCGVNLAKEMHVGHLRATVIGDALACLCERVGHRVIRQNHVGDWGLNIAMVTGKLMSEAKAGRLDPARITLAQLDALYKQAQGECAVDAAGLEAARRWNMGPKAIAELEAQVAGGEQARAAARATLVRLQAHDPEVIPFWQRIFDLTMAECLAVCARLHTRITAKDSAGESTYSDELAPTIADLVARGVAEESDGALIIRLDDPPFGIDVPCLIRKRDGGYLYATTDIPAIRRRVQKLGADRVVYAVGAPQQLHLRQVFAAATKAGYATKPGATHPSRLEHAAFGSVLGEDGKMFKTRSGESVKLVQLLDEAAARAQRVVAEKNPDLSEDERRKVAEAVAVTAIKYADMSSDRVKDYVFSFDRMLSFEGNTGPYVMYALVRIRKIFQQAAERGVGSGFAGATMRLDAPAEKSLALALLRYPSIIAGAAEALEPHRVCQYLFELGQAFSTFYDQCHVLNAPDPATLASRLRLCAITGRIFADGMDVLGLPTVERM